MDAHRKIRNCVLVWLMSSACIFCSGCIWVGDSFEPFPEFVLDGRLLDADGKPLGNQECMLSVTSWNNAYDMVKGLLDDTLDIKSRRKPVQRATTDSSGHFVVNWPERVNMIPTCGVLFPPATLFGNGSKRDTVVLVRVGQKGSPVYEMYFHRNRLKSIKRYSANLNGSVKEERLKTDKTNALKLSSGKDADRLDFVLKLQ